MGKPDRAFDVDELRFAHSGGLERRAVFVGGKVGTVETTATREPDALSWLRSRGTITHRQHEAATSWATDYERAQIGMTVCASYGGAVAVGVEAEPERRRHAKERFRDGYRAMTAPSVAWAVVVENMTLKAWAHRHGLSPRVARDRIRDALTDLGDFYGLPKGD